MYLGLEPRHTAPLQPSDRRVNHSATLTPRKFHLLDLISFVLLTRNIVSYLTQPSFFVLLILTIFGSFGTLPQVPNRKVRSNTLHLYNGLLGLFYDPVIITADTVLFELNVLPIQCIFEALLCSTKNGSIKPGSIFGQILKPSFQVFREFLLFLVADVLRNLKGFSKHPLKTQFIHASQGDFSFCQVTTAHKIKVTWRLKARV